MSISHIPRLARSFGLVLALSGLVLISACGIFSPDEKKDDIGGGPVVYEASATPDALMRNFIKVWNARDYDKYFEIRHPEAFKFEFASADIAASGEPSGIWTKPKDDESTYNMFEGQPSKDGEIVQSIEMRLIQRSAGWVPATEPELAGALKKTFDVDMIVTMTNADIYNVDGEQEFYAINIAAEGAAPNFVLLHWRDLGIGG